MILIVFGVSPEKSIFLIQIVVRVIVTKTMSLKKCFWKLMSFIDVCINPPLHNRQNVAQGPFLSVIKLYWIQSLLVWPRLNDLGDCFFITR